MNNRLQLQLKLQQAVKGVSIAAIAFYLLSILRLHFERLNRKIDGFDRAGKQAPDS